MTTKTQPRALGRGFRPPTTPKAIGVVEPAIQGRFRPITTQQLAMAWWLHQAGHITRRQLRVYFAAHEMAEQRRYTGPERRGHARYQVAQVQRLVGGRGSETAARDLSADVKRLRVLGLVSITSNRISFACSAEELHLDDSLEDFWAFFQALPNRRRTVPVPRRTLRALAAGFSRGVTAYMLAALIRSVFWHKQRGGGGEYRVDGRTKGSWVASTFGISRRTVTEARGQLIQLGWLEPLEAAQWELNKWGAHDAVNVHWTPASLEAESMDNPARPTPAHSGGPASPRPQNSGGSASPCLNRSSLPTGDLKTRRLRGTPPDPPGDCVHQPSVKKKRPKRPRRSSKAKPSIRDVRPQDLTDPKALLELHIQAQRLGLGFEGEGGQMDFFALANRALTRGQRPGALFFDLVSKGRNSFITIADEERARGQLRELRDGSTVRSGGGGEDWGNYEPPNRELTDEERVVEICIRVARQHRLKDPFRVARRVKGWTRAQWEDAHLGYLKAAQARRQQPLGGGAPSR